jgi:hypothetical protein
MGPEGLGGGVPFGTFYLGRRGGPGEWTGPKRPQGLLWDSLRGVSPFRWVVRGQPIKRASEAPRSPGEHLRAR